MHNICHKILSGNIERAKSMNEQLRELHNLMFVEPNPIPVKWALTYLKYIKPTLRLPLVELDSKYHEGFIKCLNDIDK